MNQKTIIFSFLLIFILSSCASNPKIDPKDITPAPEMAKALESELAKVVSPSSCRILGCVNFKSDINHFICTGEFSLTISSTAQEKFQIAANKLIIDKTRIDFTAEEGFGSQMLGALLGGFAGGMVTAASGGGSDHYYVGAISSSSSPVQFTLPENTKTK